MSASTNRVSDEPDRSVIGRDLVVNGKVQSSGTMRIDGQVQGDVRCVSLVAGVSGRIAGDIDGQDVIVFGHIDGNINADSVLIKETGRVEGDIASQTLAIEHGAVFAGDAKPLQESNVEMLKVVGR